MRRWRGVTTAAETLQTLPYDAGEPENTSAGTISGDGKPMGGDRGGMSGSMLTGAACVGFALLAGASAAGSELGVAVIVGNRTETVAHGAAPMVHQTAQRPADAQPGERFRDCPDCPQMVVVPAGSHRMGSPSWERGRTGDEGPVHEVKIGAPFALGVFEVTVAEFGRFVDETGYSAGSRCFTYEGGKWKEGRRRGWRNPGFGQSGGHPAACVSWDDAQAYAAWLSLKTGERYRLPSESEWEYAARAGTSTSRYWADSESGQCRHANGADASLKGRYPDWPWTVMSCQDGQAHTAPVGGHEANGWGLHDMLGNVWEWTEDCWNASYEAGPLDGAAWGHGDCAVRVLRGGSWESTPSALRTAFRVRNSAGDRNSSIGFRVARMLTPES